MTHLSPESLGERRPVLSRNLERLKKSTRGEPHLGNLDRWCELVSSDDVRGIRRVMTGLDTDPVQMRCVRSRRSAGCFSRTSAYVC